MQGREAMSLVEYLVLETACHALIDCPVMQGISGIVYRWVCCIGLILFVETRITCMMGLLQTVHQSPVISSNWQMAVT